MNQGRITHGMIGGTFDVFVAICKDFRCQGVKVGFPCAHNPRLNLCFVDLNFHGITSHKADFPMMQAVGVIL